MGFETNQLVKTVADLSDLATVREAILSAAREATEAKRQDKIDVELPSGKFTVTGPLVLSAKENPELASVEITLRAKYDKQSEINSLVRLPIHEFTPMEGTPLFTYQFPKNDEGKFPLFRDFYLNFKHLPSGRSESWKNPLPLSPAERSGEEKRKGLYAPIEIVKKLAAGELGATELVMYVEWEFVILHVTGTDLSDVREFGGEPYALLLIDERDMDFFCRGTISILNVGNRITFLQNSPAFLDEENTYAYDYHTGKIYVNPEKREHLRYHVAEYPASEVLLKFEGLSGLTVEGIVFRGATSKAACEYPFYAGQSNLMRKVGDTSPSGRLKNAAILAVDSHAMTVKSCVFRDMGTNGIMSADTSRRLTVTDSIFENVGMCGVLVGNASWKWEEGHNRNYSVRIENNLFRHIGYAYPASPAIYIGMADGLKILHNTIDGCAYSGVSAGWGWSSVPYELGEKVNIRDADIAFNYIHNFMDCLRDGGAIYVLGGNCEKSNDTRFNVMHDNYAELDEAGKGEKYGYYCDGSSSNWEVRHSVMVNCFRPLFSQYTVPSAFTYHNHLFDIYLTTPIQMASHAPYRDTCIYDCHVVTEGKEALFEKHPVAREIRDAAGCRLPL